MSFAPVLILREGDQQRLAELARLPRVPSGLAKRARMVLLAADGNATPPPPFTSLHVDADTRRPECLPVRALPGGG